MLSEVGFEPVPHGSDHGVMGFEPMHVLVTTMVSEVGFELILKVVYSILLNMILWLHVYIIGTK